MRGGVVEDMVEMGREIERIRKGGQGERACVVSHRRLS